MKRLIGVALLLSALAVVAQTQSTKSSAEGRSTDTRELAATKPIFHEEFGDLEARTEPEDWPAPEILVAKLRSSDPQTRLAALQLLGLPDKEAHRPVWGKTSPSQVIAHEVVIPDKTQLTYAALGVSATQQAIVAVQAGQMTYAAVAVPKSHGWQRIILFSCWCKYEMEANEDTLTDFVHLVPAPFHEPVMPQRYELVLSASGGGTGIYEKDEAHYRMIGGKLRQVVAFVSVRRSCPMAEPCSIEKRWFSRVDIRGKVTPALIEAQGHFPQITGDSQAEFSVRELQDRRLGRAMCRVYKWNEQRFLYTPVGTSEPCSQIPVE